MDSFKKHRKKAEKEGPVCGVHTLFGIINGDDFLSEDGTKL